MPRPVCLAPTKKPGLWVLFGARDENREHTEVVGEFLAIPVTGPQLVATVKRMLAEDASLARLRPRTAWRCVVAVGRHRRRTQRRFCDRALLVVRNAFDPVERNTVRDR